MSAVWPPLTLANIREAVESNRITCAETVAPNDLNFISELDCDYSENWRRSGSFVTSQWRDSQPNTDAEQMIYSLRGLIKAAIGAHTNDPLIWGKSLDDFDDLLRAAWLNVDDSWLNRLWYTYWSGKTPYLGINDLLSRQQLQRR